MFSAMYVVEASGLMNIWLVDAVLEERGLLLGREAAVVVVDLPDLTCRRLWFWSVLIVTRKRSMLCGRVPV